MPKRKRDSPEYATGGDASQSAKQQRVQYKIVQGSKKLNHAFKIAKGFERQKLGRRHKTAVGNGDQGNVQRIDAEIAALKALDVSASAQQYLHKTLLQIKSVAESPSLPTSVSKPAKAPTHPASLNVNARLCNSNPVKQALPAVLSEIQQALGLEVEKLNIPKKKRLRAKDYEENDAQVAKSSSDGKISGKNVITPGSDEDAIEEDAPTAYGDSDEGDFAGFDSRVASSDNDDEVSQDAEDLDVEDLERQLEAEGIARQKVVKSQQYNHAADLSLSPSESQSRSVSPEPVKARPPSKSAFVPSLTMGGYISGSGSDIDDFDVAPRKNRRGQKARREIAEKKYGARAKHLQNEGSKKDRDKGWDAKRGATGADGSRGRSKHGRRDDTGHRPTGGNDIALGTRPVVKHRDDTGPLHPSWEAAKKAKEKKVEPVRFAGKKITFD